MSEALIAELAAAVAPAPIRSDANGGHHLLLGDQDVFLHMGDDEQVLIVMPIGYLPIKPTRALADALLHSNMFDSDWAPFQLATDDHSMILQWGRLHTSELTGETLAAILNSLLGRVNELRAELARSE